MTGNGGLTTSAETTSSAAAVTTSTTASTAESTSRRHARSFLRGDGSHCRLGSESARVLAEVGFRCPRSRQLPASVLRSA